MILDRKGSIKNKIGVILTSLSIVSFLNPVPALANEDNSSKIDYINENKLNESEKQPENMPWRLEVWAGITIVYCIIETKKDKEIIKKY